ncbi:hypothetical protein ZWY2020_028502, partial [Hordeum vulgare]
MRRLAPRPPPPCWRPAAPARPQPGAPSSASPAHNPVGLPAIPRPSTAFAAGAAPQLSLRDFFNGVIISYFEFLIITEFKLPSIEPRLPLWSAKMLISYMGLDALQGKNNEYGKLSNSTPTLKTYVDDMHSSFLKACTSYCRPNLQFKSVLTENRFKVPTTKQLLAIESPPNFPMLTVPTIIDEYKEININEILEHLLHCLQVYPKNIGTPIEDHLLVQVLKQHEGQSSKFSRPQPSNWHQGANKCFKSGKLVERRIFEIEGVWVDKKTITLYFKTRGWINPRVVGCFTKLKNNERLNRGRKGLLLSSELVEHIVSIDDMVNLYFEIFFVILHFQFIDIFLLLTINHFMGKNWPFFYIMNPYYNGDSFLPTISYVVYNFKTLFTTSYGNSSSFNIGNFESRFVAAPKVNFRRYPKFTIIPIPVLPFFFYTYDSRIFLLQYVSKYKGVGLECFSNKFHFEIVTCSDNEIKLPLVTSFCK